MEVFGVVMRRSKADGEGEGARRVKSGNSCCSFVSARAISLPLVCLVACFPIGLGSEWVYLSKCT